MTSVVAPGAPSIRSSRRHGGALLQFLRYVAVQVGQAAVALLGVTTAVFFALRLSGDPARLLASENATAVDIENLRRQLGLDQPVWRQYLDYLGGLLHGDLGFSYVQHQPVLTLIGQRMPYTINLAVAALVLTAVFGISVGFIMALSRGGWAERVLMPLVVVGQAMPVFWVGILLVLFFSVTLQLLPSTGSGGLISLVLPAITLASHSTATVARVTRGAVLEQLSRDYVRTARSKGVGTFRLVWRHLLRNVSIPIVTLLALEVANLLGGAVITELIFAWPGIGQLTEQSLTARDFPVVQGIVILSAAIYIAVNLLADIIYGVIDPRTTVSEKGATG
jgi:peptide/nickel transport system permease protein